MLVPWISCYQVLMVFLFTSAWKLCEVIYNHLIFLSPAGLSSNIVRSQRFSGVSVAGACNFLLISTDKVKGL